MTTLLQPLPNHPNRKQGVKLYNLNKTEFTQKGYYMKALYVWKPMVLLTRVGNDRKAFKCGKNNQTLNTPCHIGV